MVAALSSLVEANLRRVSTGGSTGLDYSSCHRVDEDIISRIRALILSRHEHHRLNTPHNSDEHGETTSFVAGFDFSSAKSVAESALQDTDLLAILDTKRRHRSALPIMDGRRDSSATLQVITPPVPPLRNIISAEGMKTTAGLFTEPAPKSRFRLPKLVLQDKEKPDTGPKSCSDINQCIPSNDAQIHENELDCCPPCETNDAKPSKHFDRHSNLPGSGPVIEPADMSGGLEEFPAGYTNGMPGSWTGNSSSLPHKDTFTSRADVAINSRFPQASLSATRPLVSESIRNRASEGSLKSDNYTCSLLSSASQKAGARHALLKPSVTDKQPLDTGLPVPPTLSAVPVAAVLQKTIALETAELQEQATGITEDAESAHQRSRANVNTDASSRTEVIQPDAINEIPKGSRPVQDDSPLSDKTARNPSPTASAAHHPLDLQRERELVDSVEGLIQQVEEQMSKAMLSPRDSLARQSEYPSASLKESSTPIGKSTTLTPPKPHQLEHCLSSSEDKQFFTIPPPAIENHTQDPATVDVAAKDVSHEIRGSVEVPTSISMPAARSKIGQATADYTAKELSNTKVVIDGPIPVRSVQQSFFLMDKSCVGLLPAVEEAVQGAVDVAVRNAVQEIISPTGPAGDVAVDAYRRLLAESLAQAAQRADDYLRNILLRPCESSDTLRGSEGNVIFASRASRLDHHPVSVTTTTSLHGPSQNEDSRHSSVGANNQENQNTAADENLPRKYSQIEDVPANFKSHEALTVLPGVASPGKLETVPVENDDKFNGRENMPGWKLSKAFKKGYTPIPTRKSSKKLVLSPKEPAAKSMSRSSPNSAAESPARKRSFERLKVKACRGLRSIPSAGSLRSAGSDEHGQAEELLPLRSGSPSKNTNKESMTVTAVLDSQKPSGKSTVRWLKDLLSNNAPYETRFTALPSRTRKEYEAWDRAPVSLAATSESVNDLYIDKFPEPIISKPGVGKSKREKRIDPSETFSKTITDLESLMNEALFIARKAADNQDPVYAPTVLDNAVQVLKRGRKAGTDNKFIDRVEAERRLSRMLAARYSDSSSDPSIHESLIGYSGSSGACSEDEDGQPHERQIAIVSTKGPSRHAAARPPTGKRPPPFPPGSILASRKSPIAQVPLATDEKFSGALTGRRLQSADPRSMPTLNDVEIRKKINGPYLDSDEASSPRTLYLVNCPEVERQPLPKLAPQGESLSQNPREIEKHQPVASKLASKSVPNRREVCDCIIERNHPPITARSGSLALEHLAKGQLASPDGLFGKTNATADEAYNLQDIENSKMLAEGPWPGDESAATSTGHNLFENFRDHDRHGYSHSFDGSLEEHSEVLEFEPAYGVRQRSAAQPGASSPLRGVELQDMPGPNLPQTIQPLHERKKHIFNLSGKRHISLRGHHLKGFSFTNSHKRHIIARDWSPGRKRFVATISCISTALTGILVGIYAGETPSIQYYIADFHHYTVLGNVFFFVGLSIPTLFCWPLPLLHGRKPYILGAMSLAMPLIFPQALAVGQFRSPYVAKWRVGLILPRAVMGFCLGFANMNFKSMLTDLFGASLQSQNPHQEHVDEFDVRRHGGGMGAWLGLWTWCSIGSIGFGFMIGATIINNLPPAWGFYVSICIIAFVMLLNVLCPEVRRSAFRRSVAEVVKEGRVSHRLARGEVKMHMVQSGPKWWGEEFYYGALLSKKMLRQPGFLVMALYVAWIYGQMVLYISLLGALLSKDYKFRSPYVGASVTALPAGALLAIPFEKASFFSRARSRIVTSDDATLAKRFSWSSHMLRRCIFVLCLPLVSMAYTLSSGGPPTPFVLPIIFSALFGFLSSLASSECSGIIMETFDTSDLQPGMTGRPRGSSGDKTTGKRTNYSSFPRVQSAFAMCHGFGFLVAAAASGLGGSLTRHVSQQVATGIMAGILLVLSVLLLGVLIRFRNVQIIPDSKKGEMQRYHQARWASTMRRNSGVEDVEEPWRPIIIGNPVNVTRRMSLLELGSMSRFSEIRRKNKLIDEKSLEAQHPNRAAIEDVRQFVQIREHELRHKVNENLSRQGSRDSRHSNKSDVPEQGGDLGGHREMRSRNGSGKGSRKGTAGTPKKGTTMARKGIKEHE